MTMLDNFIKVPQTYKLIRIYPLNSKLSLQKIIWRLSKPFYLHHIRKMLRHMHLGRRKHLGNY